MKRYTDRSFSFQFFCICVVAFSISCRLVEASDNPAVDEILVIGSSAIVKGNLSQAKERAIEQALIKGAEDYLSHKLGNDGMINNFQRLTEGIIPSAKEGVENFHILAEARTDQQYSILVRLKINQKVIDEKLRRMGLAIMKGPALKVFFLVSERNENETVYWWNDPEVPLAMSAVELALYNEFQERGFRPINRRSNIPQSEFSEDLLALDLTDEAIIIWGKLFSADVVIRGKLGIIDQEEIFLTLKALDVNKSALICQGMHIEPIQTDSEGNKLTTKTIQKVVFKLADKLTPAIIMDAGSDQEEPHLLKITLTGLKSPKQFIDFRNFLRKDISGVISVTQNRVKKDSILFDVAFEGDESTFMKLVLKHENLPLLLDYKHTGEGTILLEVQ